MFGLMRQRGCASEPLECQRRRLHYCGTCKTLGARYGQASRPLLNHDTVFLAEVLGALAPADAWHPAYRSRNCLRLPRGEADQPLPLRLAAAVTVLMTGFKLRDRLEDRGGWHWRWSLRVLDGPLRRAWRDLQALNLPVGELDALLASQHRREQEAPTILREQGAEAALARVAGPTAVATGLVLEHGFALMGRPALREQGRALGHGFGTLIYLLDAWEDHAEDRRRGEFNALALLHGGAPALSPDAVSACRARLWRLADGLLAELEKLPMAPAPRANFATRLQANLASRLGEPVAPCSGLPPALRLTASGTRRGKDPRRDGKRHRDRADCCCEGCGDCAICPADCWPSRGGGGGDGGCCDCDCGGCDCGG